MIGTHPKTLSAFRTVTASRAPFVHIRKRCACGKVVTAKQIALYGKCDTCRMGK